MAIRLCCFLFVTATLLTSGLAEAKQIVTNETVMLDAPSWLNTPRVEKVIARMQSKLEWTIRKINVGWYADQGKFEKVHGFGPQAVAVTKNSGATISMHLGPRVTTANFDEIFGHELVHVIVLQKYKTAIPKWLEEGLANHLAKIAPVDYKWLALQPPPDDVKELAHPFKGTTSGVSYRYKASQALAEMLDKKCGLENLIRLSVERKMENYIETYCEIKDLNQAFRDWIKKKAI